MSLPGVGEPHETQPRAGAAAPGGVDLWRVIILLVAAGVALHTASRQSIVVDEADHLTAGLAYWQHGRFDIYPVNPPLVKLWATLPLLASGPKTGWAWSDPSENARNLAMNVQIWVDAYGDAIDALVLRARLMIVALTLLGALLVGHWASSLFGRAAGRAAMLLWCFHPLVLAHGTLATVDMGATVAGLAACRACARWLQAPRWRASLGVGILLGLALASKFTMLVLVPVFAVLTALAQFGQRCGWRARGRCGAQLVLVYTVSLAVLAAAYGFRGLGRGWDEHVCVTAAFQHVQRVARVPAVAWALNALAAMVPFDYLRGLDMQWLHIEYGYGAPFLGEVRRAGWWYYYPFALLVKVPACFWLALVWGILCARRVLGAAPRDAECLLLAPLGLYAVCQANPSLVFLRYLLPAMPYLCIIASSVAMAVPSRAWVGRWGSYGLVAGAVAACLWQHPHYVGYVNLWVGGPQRGWRWFSFGDMDWGQDLKALRHWQRLHPEARPMRLALYSVYQPPYPGLLDDTPPTPDNRQWSLFWWARMPHEPKVGYLAISVTLLNAAAAVGEAQFPDEQGQAFGRWLRARQPLAMVGTSILIYRFSAEDVRQWRAAAGEDRR